MLLLWLGLMFSALAGSPSDRDFVADVERFRPAGDTYGYAVTESATTLRHLQLGVGLWGNRSEAPLVQGGQPLIDHRSLADLQLAMGFARHFSVSLDLPVVLWQEGYHPDSASDRPQALRASGVSDARVGGKAVLLHLGPSPVGIAVLGQVTLPTGQGGSFLGEEAVAGMPMLILEAADGSVQDRDYHVRGAVNIGFRWRPQAAFDEVLLQDELVYRAALGVRAGRYAELGVDLFGTMSLPDRLDQPLEVVPWLKLLPHRLVTITAGGGLAVVEGIGAPEMRLFMGATLAPSFDPVYRAMIAAMEAEEDCSPGGWEDPACLPGDADLDGVPNDWDMCPVEAGLLTGADGCPLADSDGDGLADPFDMCPFEVGSSDGFQEADGCPVWDNDGDGIPNHLDMCPNEAETRNGYLEGDGCPSVEPPAAPQRVYVERARITITDTIHFDFDRASIRPESYGLMQEIARVILDHPEITHIRVEGHTDNIGGADYNLRLSQARAESVVDFLVNLGVDQGRLEPLGHGLTQPIADNATEEGQAMNRRVEFHIVARD